MDNDLISVIIPVYNTEKYLDKCISSVVNQTYKNLEIILIDDGSLDKCPQICDKWAESDNRIKVIHKPNGGVSSAKNLGLDTANGKYIGFVDSDDWISPTMYEELIRLIKDNNADISCCGMVFEYNDAPCRNVYENEFIFSSKEVLLNYILDNGITPEDANKLYNAELFNNIRFDREVIYAEDFLINYHILKKSNCVAGTKKCLYHYLQNSGNSSTTAIMTDARANSYKVFQSIVDDCKDDKALYQASIKRFTEATFAVLSRVLLVDEFCDKYYDEICNALMRYKMDILKNAYVTNRHKILIALISISRKLFKTIVKRFRSVK